MWITDPFRSNGIDFGFSALSVLAIRKLLSKMYFVFNVITSPHTKTNKTVNEPVSYLFTYISYFFTLIDHAISHLTSTIADVLAKSYTRTM